MEKNSSMTEDFFSFVLALMHARACACERERAERKRELRGGDGRQKRGNVMESRKEIKNFFYRARLNEGEREAAEEKNSFHRARKRGKRERGKRGERGEEWRRRRQRRVSHDGRKISSVARESSV